MTTLELLREARREYVTRGRCEGQYTDDHGRVCVEGALRLAAGGLRAGHGVNIWALDASARRTLNDALGELSRLLGGVKFLHAWHDAATYGEVVALLDRAIALEEEMQPADPVRMEREGMLAS